MDEGQQIQKWRSSLVLLLTHPTLFLLFMHYYKSNYISHIISATLSLKVCFHPAFHIQPTLNWPASQSLNLILPSLALESNTFSYPGSLNQWCHSCKATAPPAQPSVYKSYFNYFHTKNNRKDPSLKTHPRVLHFKPSYNRSAVVKQHDDIKVCVKQTDTGLQQQRRCYNCRAWEKQSLICVFNSLLLQPESPVNKPWFHLNMDVLPVKYTGRVLAGQ